jgi:hypothetical protein
MYPVGDDCQSIPLSDLGRWIDLMDALYRLNHSRK